MIELTSSSTRSGRCGARVPVPPLVHDRLDRPSLQSCWQLTLKEVWSRIDSARRSDREQWARRGFRIDDPTPHIITIESVQATMRKNSMVTALRPGGDCSAPPIAAERRRVQYADCIFNVSRGPE